MKAETVPNALFTLLPYKIKNKKVKNNLFKSER